MTTHFVNAGDVLDHAVRRIESLDRLIARGTDLPNHALIDLIFRIHRQNAPAGRVEITSANGIPRNYRSSSSNQVIN
jgi:hypothetical protein